MMHCIAAMQMIGPVGSWQLMGSWQLAVDGQLWRQLCRRLVVSAVVEEAGGNCFSIVKKKARIILQP